jgi:hypothetical protein
VKLTLIRRSKERGAASRIHEGDACERQRLSRLEDDLSPPRRLVRRHLAHRVGAATALNLAPKASDCSRSSRAPEGLGGVAFSACRCNPTESSMLDQGSQRLFIVNTAAVFSAILAPLTLLPPLQCSDTRPQRPRAFAHRDVLSGATFLVMQRVDHEALAHRTRLIAERARAMSSV